MNTQKYQPKYLNYQLPVNKLRKIRKAELLEKVHIEGYSIKSAARLLKMPYSSAKYIVRKEEVDKDLNLV